MEDLMLKKEFRDTLRILLESSLLLLSIPVMLGISLVFGLEAPTLDVISAVSLLTAYAFACYSGVALFRAEKRDKGLEYMLSLPLSRFKIFLYKLLPRFIFLMALAGVLSLFSEFTFKITVVPLIFLQVGTMFLSLAFDSYFMGMIGVLLLGFFYSLSGRFMYYVMYELGGRTFELIHLVSPYTVAALILGIPLAISFFLAFKNLDMKAYKYSLKPYIYIVLPVLLLHLVVFFTFQEQVFRYF
jgi:ABC-type multidrug transport system permease subunit